MIAVVCTAWRIDRTSQYRDGKAAATAHINATLSEVHGKQAVAVLEQERQAAAASDGKTAANGWALFGNLKRKLIIGSFKK